MCSILTTVHLPSHIDMASFRQKLREQTIIIYEGKGCFKNRVFQVGNIGELSLSDIQFFLKTLGNVLGDFKEVRSPSAFVSRLDPINISAAVLEDSVRIID
jgi:2-aminoethylphosphonate-pyruvate transaminase